MAETQNAKVGKSYLPWAPKSISRTRMDMKSWNTGLNLARMGENPQNWALQLVFDECDLDALVSSQWNNRKNQVFSSTFSLKGADGEVDEEQTKILKKHPLYRSLTNAALDSILYGYNLVELKINNGSLTSELVPRYNVVPQTGSFYPEYGDPSNVIKYREMAEFGVWILEFNSKTLGLMNKLVAPALFSRFAESCWSELCEIYGIPPRVLKTNTQDATMLKRAEAMMRDMGSAAWFIIDETESFDFAKGASTNGDVYNSLLKHCGAKICNLVIGGMIGQDTQNGNRAKDEVSMEMLWLLVQSDMAMLEEAWNGTILPALVKHGVLKEGLMFEFDEAEDISQLWKFVQGLLGFFDFDPEWIRQKFGVEVTGVKEQNDLATTLALALRGKEGDPDFFPEAPQDGACCGAHHIAQLTLPKDAPKSDGLITRVSEASGSLVFDPETFQAYAKTLKKGFNKSLDGRKIKLAIDTAYGIDDPHLLAAFEMNIFRFSAGKTLAEIQALNEAFRAAPSFDIFKVNASRIGDVFSDKWLRTEYDTAILVSESTATYHSLMRDIEAFHYWEYKTVGDSAVREAHAALDGLILPANDPRWSKIFPPNGWNCRCYIVARTREEVQGIDFTAEQAKVDTYFGSDDFDRAVKDGFGVNRAITGEVFTSNQQYLNAKNLTESNKLINELEPKDYKLATVEELVAKSAKAMPTYSETMEQFVGSLDTLNGRSIITDYNQRALNFPTGITKGIEQLQAVLDTLAKPSEVWLRIKGKSGYQLEYLAYYEGQAFEVTAALSELQLNITSWKKVTAATAEKKRAGMLIKSK